MGEGSRSRNIPRKRVEINVGRIQHQRGVVDKVSSSKGAARSGAVTDLKRAVRDPCGSTVAVAAREDGRARSELVDPVNNVAPAGNTGCKSKRVALVEINRPAARTEADRTATTANIQGDIAFRCPR